MTEGKLARFPHHQIQAHGKDHIDRRKDHHLGGVGIKTSRADLQKSGKQQSDKQPEPGLSENGGERSWHPPVVQKGDPIWQRLFCEFQRRNGIGRLAEIL
jgi:hypothetical protein